VSLLVVDASVAAKWFINEPDSAAAIQLIATRQTLQAPAFLATELANIFWKQHLRSGLPINVWTEAKEQLPAMVSILQADFEIHDPAFVLAVTHRHPVYDCLYLALGNELDCKVITADRRFAAAFSSGAMAGKVQLLEDWVAEQV
jgi:predicted nucleic acid-binding protein